MIRPNRTPRQLSPGRCLGFGIIAALMVTGTVGCKARDRSRPQAGGATNHRAQEARKQAEGYALAAVEGAALAQVAAHPELDRRGERTVLVSATVEEPKGIPAQRSSGPAAKDSATHRERTNPVSRSPASLVVIRERVVTEIPYPTEAEADDRTLDLAAEKIAQTLRKLDPPIEYLPSRAVVRNEFAIPNSRRPRSPSDEEIRAMTKAGIENANDHVYVEYTVEMTADQIRELRTRDRVGHGFRIVGMVSAIALAGFLFLRLDDWTKGYLTSWLAFVAVALAGGVVAALIIV